MNSAVIFLCFSWPQWRVLRGSDMRLVSCLSHSFLGGGLTVDFDRIFSRSFHLQRAWISLIK